MNGDRRHKGAPTEESAITGAELARGPGTSPRRPGGLSRRLAPYFAVGAGAALGANLRYGVGLWAAASARKPSFGTPKIVTPAAICRAASGASREPPESATQ
jgi:hypothetical protein